MNKHLKYQVWASQPKATAATPDHVKYLGWHLACTTDDLNTLFLEKAEAEINYQSVVVTKAIELKVSLGENV